MDISLSPSIASYTKRFLPLCVKERRITNKCFLHSPVLIKPKEIDVLKLPYNLIKGERIKPRDHPKVNYSKEMREQLINKPNRKWINFAKKYCKEQGWQMKYHGRPWKLKLRDGLEVSMSPGCYTLIDGVELSISAGCYAYVGGILQKLVPF